MPRLANTAGGGPVRIYAAPCGRGAGQPAFMPAPKARGVLWEAIPFYSAGLLLGSDAPCRKKHAPKARGVLREAILYQEKSARQDSGVWECGLFASRVSASAAGGFIGSGRVIVREVPYRKRYRAMVRGFFWESPPVRAEEGAGSACRASPLLCALAAYAACGGQSPLLCRAKGAGGFLWEAPLYQEKFARQDSGF